MNVAEIPVLQTARLRLRAHTLEDLEPCAAMWAEPLVVRHIGGRAFTRQETWFKLLRYAGLWALLGYGYWAIEERESGLFIGEAGFADFKREIEPPLDGAPEIGWAFASHAHGKGYATEAVQAALAWADEHLPAARTACIIGSANGASIRVAEKCGYLRSATTSFLGEPTLVFFRSR